ncbi:MBOAT family protein [Aeoliella sp. SH292]|uniref:MBOAT family protein n=1 Tax=Aeoliella sp. SH292 TaxID=3454464 RepID=UPI003F97241B
MQAASTDIAPLRGWWPLLLLPPVVWFAVPGDWPRWALMWALAVTLFACLKWLTWRRTPAPGATPLRHLAFLVAWPGLDARAFLTAPSSEVQRPTVGEWLFAAAKFLFGGILFFTAHHLLPATSTLLLGWAGMVGLVFLLHFGSFHLLSCFWRSQGVKADPLMDWPILSTGISDFWGRRWNTAFRDLAHRFLFRPFTRWVGPRWGILAGFVFSGVVHDIVISLPAGGGYGLPTLYFLLQPVGMFSERSTIGKRLGLGRGWRGRMFAALVIALPAPLLFHAYFVNNIIYPFMQALGAA